jgi:dimethylhistidine N-methyltransferase
MKVSTSAWLDGGDRAPTPASHAAGRFLIDVQRGLALRQKRIPSKYFYDARGSALFEAICLTPEYYLTRTEMQIMRTHVDAMSERIGQGVALIEPGSGASLKTRLLIEALRPAVYVPIDVSEQALTGACAELGWRFPFLAIDPLHRDFMEQPLPRRAGAPRLVYFPGSTIGNLEPPEAAAFLDALRLQLDREEMLLIGVDLKKDARILHAAYNDAQGVTAAFNLNLLARINRELEGDFDVAAFRHLAFYNEACGWVEMHLQSLRAQTVQVADRSFDFRLEESLHTEISCKYAPEEFLRMAAGAGFAADGMWTDERGFFGVYLLRAA